MRRSPLVTIMTACLLAMSLHAGAAEQAYVIGEGDVLEVSVWRNADVSRTVTVRPDGMITLPLIHDVKAAGLTTARLREQVAQALAGFVNQPDVSVTVAQARSYQVYVLGGAATNGLFSPYRPVTAAQLLAQAGGAGPGADLAGAYVSRGAEKIPVDLSQELRGDGNASQLLLRGGDTLVIPLLQEYARRILVVGEVKQPRALPFKEGMTVMDAFLEAGGGTEFADLANVRVARRRNGNGERSDIRVDLGQVSRGNHPAWNIALLAGDMITVPYREGADPRVLVVGAVKNPRSIPYHDGLTVLDVFVEAGGGTDYADLDSVKVVRPLPGGKQEEIPVDLSRVLKKGELSRNAALAPGDIVVVPE